ncbi:MAG: T9SS type A sorting domain-containing protein, partial [Bacteroidales bacterium]|nr:T9SS type A sorting domain-containing protein [Bacteroidales bacterium]
EEGLFEFEDMAYGTYKLKVEMPGVNSEIATVVLDENNQTINVEFIVKGSSAYLSIDNLSQVISGIGEIYPNPVSDYASIEVTLNNNSNVTVNIFNQLGQVVYSSDKTLVSGKQLIKLNTSELPEGFYNVQFRGENGGILVKKFVKVR